jgi:HNH endonuclease
MNPDLKWFLERVEIGVPSDHAPWLGPCHEWLWTKTKKGYAVAKWRKGGTTTAHRFAWLVLIGPIPPGYVVDHLCRNRGCVNVGHLEPVPPRVNSQRGVRDNPYWGPRPTQPDSRLVRS